MTALAKETEAAQTLIYHIRALGAADDEQGVHDAIEGETNLFEAISEAVKSLGEDEANAEALKAYEQTLAARRARIDRRAEAVRAAIMVAMDTAEQKKIETAFGTLTLGVAPRKVIVTEEADVPAQYWKDKDPVLDKKALLADLKAGCDIPGARLSNGGFSLTVRRA